MSILIKGMEMPTERESFNLTIKYNGTVFDTETGIQIAEANEIPPHGRMIDADAFLALINDSTILSDFLKCIINPLIRGEPTVIPADKAEEGE